MTRYSTTFQPSTYKLPIQLSTPYNLSYYLPSVDIASGGGSKAASTLGGK
jgi:hypothetical protein